MLKMMNSPSHNLLPFPTLPLYVSLSWVPLKIFLTFTDNKWCDDKISYS